MHTMMSYLQVLMIQVSPALHLLLVFGSNFSVGSVAYPKHSWSYVVLKWPNSKFDAPNIEAFWVWRRPLHFLGHMEQEVAIYKNM
jgi:hypothetical protein